MGNGLKSIISQFSSKSILVAGDVMLDHYIYAEPYGKNPESDAPKLKVIREDYFLGGAGNVAHNIHSLGGLPHLLGITGRDYDAKHMHALAHFPDMRMVQDILRPTTKKTRLVQVFEDKTQKHHARYDNESKEKARGTLALEINAHAKWIVENYNISCAYLSDYDKGVFTNYNAPLMIRELAQKGIPVFVDPKPKNIALFANSTVFKLNMHEAKAVFGCHAKSAGTDQEEFTMQSAASFILENYKVQHICITLGDQGVYVKSADGEEFTLPTRARRVGDTVGAGDTFGATFALSMVSGATLREAAEIANYAAGLAVETIGTATVNASQLKEYISNHPDNPESQDNSEGGTKQGAGKGQ